MGGEYMVFAAKRSNQAFCGEGTTENTKDTEERKGIQKLAASLRALRGANPLEAFALRGDFRLRFDFPLWEP